MEWLSNFPGLSLIVNLQGQQKPTRLSTLKEGEILHHIPSFVYSHIILHYERKLSAVNSREGAQSATSNIPWLIFKESVKYIMNLNRALYTLLSFSTNQVAQN